jgi:nucleoside-diphosphate-sugar epimerase
MNGKGSWETYHGINTLGTLNVISGCRESGVPRLIYTSSPSVVFDGADHIDADESLPYPTKWLCHYPHSKALAEQAVLAANTLQIANRLTSPTSHLGTS